MTVRMRSFSNPQSSSEVSSFAPTVLSPDSDVSAKTSRRQLYPLQAPPLLGHPTDPAEREADHIANQLISQDGAEYESGISLPNSRNDFPASRLQNREVNSDRAGGTPIAGSTRVRLEAIGDTKSFSLSAPLRGYFHRKLGPAVANARLYHNRESDQLAREFNADAFSYRSGVFFRRGAFDPYSPAGKHLLAHELVHTAQSAAAGSVVRRGKKIKSSPAVVASTTPTVKPKIEKLNFDKLDQYASGRGITKHGYTTNSYPSNTQGPHRVAKVLNKTAEQSFIRNLKVKYANATSAAEKRKCLMQIREYYRPFTSSKLSPMKQYLDEDLFEEEVKDDPKAKQERQTAYVNDFNAKLKQHLDTESPEEAIKTGHDLTELHPLTTYDKNDKASRDGKGESHSMLKYQSDLFKMNKDNPSGQIPMSDNLFGLVDLDPDDFKQPETMDFVSTIVKRNVKEMVPQGDASQFTTKNLLANLQAYQKSKKK